jgi:hypothetical protein
MASAIQWQHHELVVDAKLDVRVLVRRLLPVPGDARRAVLLVPGANSSSDTFVMPDGGLVRHLAERGCDVWTLDWRASPLALNRILKLPRSPQDILDERAAFSLDHIVRQDIPATLALIRAQTPSGAGQAPLAVHAHCVGGGGIAMAIAQRLVETKFGVDRVVLSTLGLFYEVPWGSWIKAEDFLLESILQPHDQPGCRAIDPREPACWPQIFTRAYQRWPESWLPPRGTSSDDFLRQLSFMVGQPYSRDRIEPSIDGAPIESVFGPLHLGLYTQLGQMVRRGYAAPLDVRDQIDRVRLRRRETARPAPVGYFEREPFESFRITLLAAGDNGVWHRDSIDLMYEWLRRSPTMRCDKLVIPDYNIQELYWGPKASVDVYRHVGDALGAPGKS